MGIIAASLGVLSSGACGGEGSSSAGTVVFQYGFRGSIISVLEGPAACSAGYPTLTGTEDIASVVHHCPKYGFLRGQVL